MTIIDSMLMIICAGILSRFMIKACKKEKGVISSIPYPMGYIYYSNGYRLCLVKKKFTLHYRAYLLDEEKAGNLPVLRDFLNRPYIKTNAKKTVQAERYVDYFFN